MTASLTTPTLLTAAGTLIISALLTPVVRALLMRFRVFDVPNARSSHTVTVVRGLGIAVWAAMLIASLAVIGAALLNIGVFGAVFGAVFSTAGSGASAAGGSWLLAATLFAVLNLTVVLGLIEDLRGLSVKSRSALQLLAAIFIAVLLVALASPPPLAAILMVLFGIPFISSFINVANFMDGLNGISALHGIIGGVCFWLLGTHLHSPALAIAGAITAAAFLGFLPWNLLGYGFLGDVGSYLLGTVLVSLSFAALLAGSPLLAAISPLVIYFGDVGWTLVRRIRRGAKWHEAHREHAYQRLQQLGMTHLAASAITAGFTATAVALGLLNAVWQGPLAFAVLLAGGSVILLCYLNLPRLLPAALPAVFPKKQR